MANHLPQPGQFFCPAVAGLSGIPVTEKLDLDLSGVKPEQQKAVLDSFYTTYPDLKAVKPKPEEK